MLNTGKTMYGQKALSIGLCVLLLWSTLAPNVSALAFKQCSTAAIRVERQLLDVDGDGQVERFVARFDILADGSAEGTAKIVDGIVTYTYKMKTGEISCSNGNINLNLMSSLTLDDGKQVTAIDSIGIRLNVSKASPDCLIWDIDGNDVTLLFMTPAGSTSF
ncbi:MAG: hypothetical protein KDE56_08300 [Anaerolineales bacterium]|nr:hypothetical protein [Anaerolineales bacterium]